MYYVFATAVASLPVYSKLSVVSTHDYFPLIQTLTAVKHRRGQL